MKIPPVQPNTAARRAKKSDPALSNEAFYLIAIAILLRKESGDRSMLHYLVPGLPTNKTPKLRN